jgi:hypothetical protein
MNHQINLVGTDKQSVQGYWKSEGAPTAYLGMTMPGFPNFFSLLGKQMIRSNLSHNLM